MPAEFVAGARSQPWWAATEALAHTLPYDATIMGDYSLPVERAAAVTIPDDRARRRGELRVHGPNGRRPGQGSPSRPAPHPPWPGAQHRSDRPHACLEGILRKLSPAPGGELKYRPFIISAGGQRPPARSARGREGSRSGRQGLIVVIKAPRWPPPGQTQPGRRPNRSFNQRARRCQEDPPCLSTAPAGERPVVGSRAAARWTRRQARRRRHDRLVPLARRSSLIHGHLVTRPFGRVQA